MSIKNYMDRESSLICIFFLLLVSLLVFCGLIIGNRHGKNSKAIEIDANSIGSQSDMPHFPEFPPGKGVLIYPDRGLLVIQFPEQIEIIVKEEGCE